MFEITCIFCHFSKTRFPFETLGTKAFSDRSVQSCIYTVTFRFYWETEVRKISKISL